MSVEARQQWIECTRNKMTQQRGWVMGVRYVDLGTSVPFRPIYGAKVHPKYKLSSDAELGECLLDQDTIRSMKGIQF